MTTRGLPTWPWSGGVPESLPVAESVLLDATRSWVEATREGRAPMAALRLPLVTEGVGEAARPLDAVLQGIALPGSMGCRLCPRLTPAEGALLMALALAQRAPRREALAAFLRLAPPGAAYAAIGPALAVGLTLRRAGLLLANPLRAEP